AAIFPLHPYISVPSAAYFHIKCSQLLREGDVAHAINDNLAVDPQETVRGVSIFFLVCLLTLLQRQPFWRGSRSSPSISRASLGQDSSISLSVWAMAKVGIAMSNAAKMIALFLMCCIMHTVRAERLLGPFMSTRPSHCFFLILEPIRHGRSLHNGRARQGVRAPSGTLAAPDLDAGVRRGRRAVTWLLPNTFL